MDWKLVTSMIIVSSSENVSIYKKIKILLQMGFSSNELTDN